MLAHQQHDADDDDNDRRRWPHRSIGGLNSIDLHCLITSKFNSNCWGSRERRLRAGRGCCALEGRGWGGGGGRGGLLWNVLAWQQDFTPMSCNEVSALFYSALRLSSPGLLLLLFFFYYSRSKNSDSRCLSTLQNHHLCQCHRAWLSLYLCLSSFVALARAAGFYACVSTLCQRKQNVTPLPLLVCLSMAGHPHQHHAKQNSLIKQTYVFFYSFSFFGFFWCCYKMTLLVFLLRCGLFVFLPVRHLVVKTSGWVLNWMWWLLLLRWDVQWFWDS